MTDKMTESEQSLRHDVTLHEEVSCEDHISDIAMVSLERNVAPYCKF